MSLDTPPGSPLDPKRPWITDERALFSRLNFGEVFTNPAGLSPAIHFRRAWAVLALMSLVAYVLGRVFVDAAGGGDLRTGVGLAFLGIVMVATVGAISLHARRARDAGKNPLWALAVLAPVLSMLIALIFAAGAGMKAYEVADAVWLYNKDAEALERGDPAAYALAKEELAKREERARRRGVSGRTARRALSPGAATGRGSRRRGRGRSGDITGPGAKRPSELAVVTQTMWSYGAPAWLLPSMGLAFWSLFWLGRLPSISPNLSHKS